MLVSFYTFLELNLALRIRAFSGFAISLRTKESKLVKKILQKLSDIFIRQMNATR
jgi:hypothetical protein